MIIGMDYDGTYTEDPEMWLSVIHSLSDAGHTVIVVTMRFPSEGASMDPDLVNDYEVVFTSRAAKADSLFKQKGLKPNVWIDDHPIAIYKNAEEIWGVATSEGDVRSGNGRDLG